MIDVHHCTWYKQNEKEPSTIPGDLQKALFTLVDITLVDIDIITGDIVAVLGDVLEVMKSKDERKITRLTPRIKTLLTSTQKVHHDVEEVLSLSHHKKFANTLKSRMLNDQ